MWIAGASEAEGARGRRTGRQARSQPPVQVWDPHGAPAASPAPGNSHTESTTSAPGEGERQQGVAFKPSSQRATALPGGSDKSSTMVAVRARGGREAV